MALIRDLTGIENILYNTINSSYFNFGLTTIERLVYDIKSYEERKDIAMAVLKEVANKYNDNYFSRISIELALAIANGDEVPNIQPTDSKYSEANKAFRWLKSFLEPPKHITLDPVKDNLIIKESLESGKLSVNLYNEYTQEYCWYCGQRYKGGLKYKNYLDLEKNTSKREGVARVYRTYSGRLEIPACVNCHRLYTDYLNGKEKAKKIANISYYILFAITLFIFVVTTSFDDIGSAIGSTILAGVFIFGFTYTLYTYIVYRVLRKNEKDKMILDHNLRWHDQVPSVLSAEKDSYYES